MFNLKIINFIVKLLVVLFFNFILLTNTKQISFNTDEDCSDGNSDEQKEIKLSGEYPYMFAIGWPKEGNVTEGDEYNYLFGGALISDLFILTSAEEFYYFQDPPAVARFIGNGNGTFHPVKLVIPIERIIIHPNYDHPFKHHNLALVKLFKSSKNRLSQFAKLPSEGPKVGESLTIVGLTGLYSYKNRRAADALKIANDIVISNEECGNNSQYQPDEIGGTYRFGITQSLFCITANGTDINRACEVLKFGGQIIRRQSEGNYIFGMLANYIQCPSNFWYTPAVFTKISSYKSWIESVIEPSLNENIPYSCYLQWGKSDTCSLEGNKCAGVLISPDFVLIAAHCLLEKKDDVPVLLINGEEQKILEMHVHDEYQYPLPYHDIGLIKINRIHGSSVKLWHQNDLSNSPLFALNIGNSSRDILREKEFLETQLTLVPKNICNQYYQNFPGNFTQGITDNMICAEDKLQRWDLGKGYSDGPLVTLIKKNGRTTSYLVGMAAVWVNCEHCPPAVYTRISSELDWINKFVRINGN